MIITVTLNPAMDKTINVNDFSLGEVNRVAKIKCDIGGKGINVSKVLKNFGVSSRCAGFLGGSLVEDFSEEMTKRGIVNDFTIIQGSTRTNIKVVDDVNKVFTDINEAGPSIEEKELNSLIEKFKELCSRDDIVVLSGSVGSGVPKDIYGNLIRIAKGKGAFVILDADGKLLTEGVAQKPNIIKPNKSEFERLLNKKFGSYKEIIIEAKKFIDDGMDKVLISLGKEGALLVSKKGSFYGKPIDVPVKGTVGAGDSMVASLVYSKLNNLSDEETLKYAIAAGSASVSLEGTEACTLEQVTELVGTAKVLKID